MNMYFIKPIINKMEFVVDKIEMLNVESGQLMKPIVLNLL